MAEVLIAPAHVVSDSSGRAYSARVIGRHASDGLWEGWLEFVPLDGDDVLVGEVESRQPERVHLLYWATGLTAVYLEGALQRARSRPSPPVRVHATPFSDRPALRRRTAPDVAPGPEPVLDPFEVARHSPDVLRQELGALNRPRLLNIIAAFDLNPGREDLAWMTDAQLAHFISVAVETQMAIAARRPVS